MSLKLQHLDLQKNRIIINSTKAFRGAKLQTANQMVAKEDMKRTNLLCIFSPSVNAKREIKILLLSRQLEDLHKTYRFE